MALKKKKNFFGNFFEKNQVFGNVDPKCTETDLKKSQICPIWGQSDPICMSNVGIRGVCLHSSPHTLSRCH